MAALRCAPNSVINEMIYIRNRKATIAPSEPYTSWYCPKLLPRYQLKPVITAFHASEASSAPHMLALQRTRRVGIQWYSVRKTRKIISQDPSAEITRSTTKSTSEVLVVWMKGRRAVSQLKKNERPISPINPRIIQKPTSRFCRKLRREARGQARLMLYARLVNMPDADQSRMSRLTTPAVPRCSRMSCRFSLITCREMGKACWTNWVTVL